MMKLPLFPLHVVLFPGMPLSLHIFEPRYRLMMRTCIESDRPFGVVLIRQGMEALGPPAEPFDVGCSARILEVERLEDGRMNLTVVGEERFLIREMDTSQPYLNGMVTSYPLENPRPLEVLRKVRGLQKQVRLYLKMLADQVKEEVDLSEMELPEDASQLLYLSASLLQIPVVEKQPLLEASSASSLLEQLTRLYRREIALIHPAHSVEEDQARRSSWLN